MTEPAFLRIGDGYFVTWGETVSFEFQYLREHHDGLAAELSVVAEGRQAFWGRLSLASAISRTGVVKACGEGGQKDWPWRRMVDESCRLVVLAHRRGAPAVALQPKPPEAGKWLVPGLVPVGETTILFGDGGSGKSLFALAFAVSSLLRIPLGGWLIAPIRQTLYLDWESSHGDHENRLWGLTGPFTPVPEGSILYRAMTRPLVDEAAEVRALVAKHQVDLVICDSLGPACGADPETAGAATGALTALRSLAPASRLVIAHVSKAEADRQYGTARPFGSVYVYNLARSVVEARRNDSPDQGEFTCTFTHTKSNTGPRQGQTAVRWVFSEEGYILARKGEPDMARAPLRMQIKDALRAGKKTVQELAEELHRSETEIRVRLNEMEKRTEVVRLTVHQGGRANKVPWGLAEQSVQVPEW